ncbi:uracil-DNA glycosylase family protein [Alteromonas sp. ASW11-19]|uniref:Uracil-DNA glycosylase family protein n=1 Tax=Alteromonas salexigens TaxID=2982530 RepID=A0ABT2VMF1_9ALTE|nr:uracil-DNA glycosylase family protein [Alteromonas salexigens]MCU7553648.1 uracil-DNA glycosylase family protein [Alteromonas salexigens]
MFSHVQEREGALSVRDTNNNGQLAQRASACRFCSDLITHEPKPVFLLNPAAKIALISQAPGRLAHESGKPWNDASGERLRRWLGLTSNQFYCAEGVSVIPMSFCFPGYKNGADAPPLKPCAPKWHESFLQVIKPRLTLFIGRYAQSYYLPQYQKLTDAVSDWRALSPTRFVLPHPSGRNNRWFRQHPWFEQELVPHLQRLVAGLHIP